jgi:hypothetical protein
LILPQRLPQSPLDLLLQLQVLQVRQEVLVAAAVLQVEPEHHQPQGSDHGFVPEELNDGVTLSDYMITLIDLIFTVKDGFIPCCDNLILLSH